MNALKLLSTSSIAVLLLFVTEVYIIPNYNTLTFVSMNYIQVVTLRIPFGLKNQNNFNLENIFFQHKYNACLFYI